MHGYNHDRIAHIAMPQYAGLKEKTRQFEPPGSLDSTSVEAGLTWSSQYPELPSQGSVLTLSQKEGLLLID